MKSKLKAIRASRRMALLFQEYIEKMPMLNEEEKAILVHIESFLNYTYKWRDKTAESTLDKPVSRYPYWTVYTANYWDRAAGIDDQRADLDKRAPYRHS